MVEFLRILKHLIFKNLLVCRRQWYVVLLVHFLIPLGIFLIMHKISVSGAQKKHISTIVPERTFPKLSQQDLNSRLYGNYTLYFAPNNSRFVNTLIGKLEACYDYQKSVPIIGFSSEEELIARMQKDNSYRDNAIVFEGDNIDESPKHLKYKIRSKNLRTMELYDFNYFDPLYFYTSYGTAQLQMCLDKAFIKLKAKDVPLPEIFVQQIPYPSHEYTELDKTFFDNELKIALCTLVVIAFIFPLVAETSKVLREKLSGVNVLMSMNGVSTTLTLLSWLITGWIFISILCVMPLVCTLTRYGNIFIIWLVLEIYIIHLLAYGLHISQYFSKYIVFTFCFLIINVGPIALDNLAFNEENHFVVPYLGIFFPNLLVYRFMDECEYYRKLGGGIKWTNLFTVGNSTYKVGGSIGMIIILSIIGIVFHFIMAVYINALNPGKYGTKKHPLFFLKAKMKTGDQSNLENGEYNASKSKYFESVSSNIYSSGIQVQNLKKTYNIGLINKKTVEALRGVSINFYKGQITSLLGHNGAGKTTMMSILTGMTPPSEGSVLINSKNIRDFPTEVMNDLGLCSQEDMFFPNLTICEQFLFFAKLKGKGKSSSEITQYIRNLLGKLKLTDKLNALPNSLSGGQKRRLCFGMAIAGNPSTLILDEPTSGLDPESRRVIWDILLKMRGEKTILISTHDMEEADVLGDRIAIIHKGKLKSYGSPMFMKKLLGQGDIEVTLSVETGFNIEKLRDALNCDMNILSEDSNKVIFNIPNSPGAPDSLDNIEQKKGELGITGLSVSLISLEQIFLKITEESKDTTKSTQPNVSFGKKLKGFCHTLQILRALFYKKMLYTIYNLPVIIFVLFWTMISLLFISMILKFVFITNPENQPISVQLDMYKNPITFYQSHNDKIGQNYKDITEKYAGTAFNVKNSNLSKELLEYAANDLDSYDKRVIASLELTKNNTGRFSANAMYSNGATYSFPISINLMSNAILKSLAGVDYSISMSYQQILESWNYYSSSYIVLVTGYSTAFVFSIFLFTAIPVFVIHPRLEASTNAKKLQRMTGVSTFSYWGTMFIFDFIVLLSIALLSIGSFFIMSDALDLRMFGETEFQFLLVSIVLFIINVLPILYIFSFINAKVTSLVKLLIYVPLIIVIVEVAMMMIKIIFDGAKTETVLNVRKFQKRIFLTIPYISFLHSQIFIHLTAHSNSRCKMLPNTFYDGLCSASGYNYDICCKLDCYDGKCKKPFKYFNNFEGFSYQGLHVEDVALEESLIYLCVTPIILFAILIALENQLVQKLMAKVKKYAVPEYPIDEKVKYEKSVVSQKISVINTKHNSSREFLVYELSKHYKDIIAVKDVSFRVNPRECFGLLGVNGAGKSTTFRMMTGTEVPDHGVMYMDQKSSTYNSDYFFSRIGYCPQNDALIKCLNSYDHLRLFARLRGVPENSVEIEVKEWIQKLNLSACASNPCGTYSGGNKRRLNIAIALIGNPDLILLDEPTTGVDPGARRSLWNVIKSCQAAGQAVILTSHSMEECEALCNRLAIMVSGKFVCIGQSQELKQRFGAGYDIRIKMNPEKTQSQLKEIKDHMLRTLNCELVDENMGYLMYHVKSTDTTWRTMYDAVNAIKDKCDCIDDFSVLSSTLEQLFLLFARTADKNT